MPEAGGSFLGLFEICSPGSQILCGIFSSFSPFLKWDQILLHSQGVWKVKDHSMAELALV